MSGLVEWKANAFYRSKTCDRAAMVRLVVAQQWGVAITLHDSLSWLVGQPHIPDAGWTNRAADLPCAVDVINDLMGVE